MDSVSNCRTMRPRCAPRATRSANSAWRAVPRASSRIETLPQLIASRFGHEHCSCCRDALASAAHELKTPLAIMGGYLQLLLAQKLGPLNPRQVEVLTEMQANGVRLSNFIQNLLTYTSLKVDRFEMQYEAGDI